MGRPIEDIRKLRLAHFLEEYGIENYDLRGFQEPKVVIQWKESTTWKSACDLLGHGNEKPNETKPASTCDELAH